MGVQTVGSFACGCLAAICGFHAVLGDVEHDLHELILGDYSILVQVTLLQHLLVEIFLRSAHRKHDLLFA